MSTICRTQLTRSRVVASFQSHGFHAPESISFPASRSAIIRMTYSRGKLYSLTLPPPPRITQKPCALGASRLSRPRMQRKAVGSNFFPCLELSRHPLVHLWRRNLSRPSPPTVKSLSIVSSQLPSQLFNLVPRLHDMSVVIHDFFHHSTRELITVQPSTPPAFTSLKLSVGSGLYPIVPRLLSLPTNYKKLDLKGTYDNCSFLATALVEKSRDTLGSIRYQFTRRFFQP